MITGPVPVSPHDTPKPRRSHQSARALRHRETVAEPDRSTVPVPVMFTLHGWDPNVKRLEDWITRRLMETYPLFAGKHGKAAAAKLASTNRIAVILDGLDEMSDELQPVALQALSTQAAFRLVLLGRTTEMAAAAEQALLAGAVTVELQEITPSVAADYLTRVQLDPPPSGWHELTIRLRAMPDSPLAKALSTPLSLTLVRDTYHKGDSVRDLLRFCDAGGPDISSEEIEDHLLDRVLPAAYAPQPGQTPCKYELEKAQHSLALIAVRMNDEGTRDLAWWQIPMWLPRTTSTIAHCLLIWVVAGIATGFIGGLGGLANGLGFGIVFGLLGAIWQHYWPRPPLTSHCRWYPLDGVRYLIANSL